jgi:hypothetical protein
MYMIGATLVRVRRAHRKYLSSWKLQGIYEAAAISTPGIIPRTASILTVRQTELHLPNLADFCV